MINNRLFSCEFKHICHKEILTWEIPGLYKMFNPSITKIGDKEDNRGYILCTRYSNKTIKNLFMYMYSDYNYKSKVCIAYLSPNLQKIQKVIFPNITIENINCKYESEDPRITYHNNHYYISITEFRSKKEILPTLYKFDHSFNLIRRLEYNMTGYFKYIKPSTVQKNWCPFSHNGKLLLHTDTYPEWRIFQIDENTGDMSLYCSVNTEKLFSTIQKKIFIRCSTSPKHFSVNSLICGLHTKQFCGVFPTIRTMLVEIDKHTLLPIRRTDMFCVDGNDNHVRIQFLSGLETDDHNIYLTYGIGDYKCSVKRIPKSHLYRHLFLK